MDAEFNLQSFIDRLIHQLAIPHTYMTGSIAHNIETIRRDLPPTVRLMAVSKQVPTSASERRMRRELGILVRVGFKKPS